MEQIRNPGLKSFLLLLLATLGLSIAASLAVKLPPGGSVMKMGYFAGETTDSLLHGRGLTFCSEGMGTPGNPICFHSGRMPLVTLVIALGVRIFGDDFRRVVLLKTLLLLIPLEFAIFLVCRHLPGGSRNKIIVALLFVPFCITQFLANVTNVHVEENYTYSLLGVALAILWFTGRPGFDRESERLPGMQLGQGVIFGLAVGGLFLAKSSMLLVAAALLIGFLLQRRADTVKMVAIVLILAAPAGWALYQHHASGRYSLGTSLDGINFHKGNSDVFYREYPPRPPTLTLDDFDSELNRGHSFADEWAFNDFHHRAAVEFIRTHPLLTARGWLTKLDVFFLSVHKYGSEQNRGLARIVETGGLLLFRLLFWGAILLSVGTLLRVRSRVIPLSVRDGVLFLAVTAGVAIPYVVGFAYTRHVSVLIYPTVLLWCRVLSTNGDLPASKG